MRYREGGIAFARHIVIHLHKRATRFFSPSESEQKMRELEQITIKLEEEIREQEIKLKCEFKYYYENKCNTRHQRTYHWPFTVYNHLNLFSALFIVGANS